MVPAARLPASGFRGEREREIRNPENYSLIPSATTLGDDRRHRRLGGKWAKARCPPGLDICREEAKREAEEKAERARSRAEAETQSRKELEDLNEEQKAAARERAAANEEKRLRRTAEQEAAEQRRREEEEKRQRDQKQLFQGYMKVGAIILL